MVSSRFSFDIFVVLHHVGKFDILKKLKKLFGFIFFLNFSIHVNQWTINESCHFPDLFANNFIF